MKTQIENKREEMDILANSLYRANMPRNTYCMLDLATKYADDADILEFMNWVGDTEDPDDHVVNTLDSGNSNYADMFDAFETIVNIRSESKVKNGHFVADWDGETGDPIDLREQVEDFAINTWDLVYDGLDVFPLVNNTYAVYEYSKFIGLVSAQVVGKEAINER